MLTPRASVARLLDTSSGPALAFDAQASRHELNQVPTGDCSLLVGALIRDAAVMPSSPMPPRCSRWSTRSALRSGSRRSEEHTSELQSLRHIVCRLLLET